MIQDEDTPRRDPVSENMALLNGKPIKVFEEQDHAAHMAVHQQFINDPRFGGNEQAKQVLYGQMLAHIGQHMAFLYQQQMQAQYQKVYLLQLVNLMKNLEKKKLKKYL